MLKPSTLWSELSVPGTPTWTGRLRLVRRTSCPKGRSHSNEGEEGTRVVESSTCVCTPLRRWTESGVPLCPPWSSVRLHGHPPVLSGSDLGGVSPEGSPPPDPRPRTRHPQSPDLPLMELITRVGLLLRTSDPSRSHRTLALSAWFVVLPVSVDLTSVEDLIVPGQRSEPFGGTRKGRRGGHHPRVPVLFVAVPTPV